MSTAIITDQPGLRLLARISSVPYSQDRNLQLIQILPNAERPREQVVLNVNVSRDDLFWFSRCLESES